MRILITGSRDWTDVNIIRDAIGRVLAGSDPQFVWIVTGACPTGADFIAAHLAKEFGFRLEEHPADWSQGRSAGPKRNAKMVGLGADVCLAFLKDCSSPNCTIKEKHLSHGADGCAKLAVNAGIPTLRYYEKEN